MHILLRLRKGILYLNVHNWTRLHVQTVWSPPMRVVRLELISIRLQWLVLRQVLPAALYPAAPALVEAEVTTFVIVLRLARGVRVRVVVVLVGVARVHVHLRLRELVIVLVLRVEDAADLRLLLAHVLVVDGALLPAEPRPLLLGGLLGLLGLGSGAAGLRCAQREHGGCLCDAERLCVGCVGCVGCHVCVVFTVLDVLGVDCAWQRILITGSHCGGWQGNTQQGRACIM